MQLMNIFILYIYLCVFMSYIKQFFSFVTDFMIRFMRQDIKPKFYWTH